MTEKFNVDFLIKQVNSHKEELSAKKELPSDIEKHPIDQLDILVAQCNYENCDKTIESIKKIIEKNPGLTDDLLESIGTQKKIAEFEKKKCEEIKDTEMKILENTKWDNKIKALNRLMRAARGEKDPKDEVSE